LIEGTVSTVTADAEVLSSPNRREEKKEDRIEERQPLREQSLAT
jgi:hypothetical protein